MDPLKRITKFNYFHKTLNLFKHSQFSQLLFQRFLSTSNSKQQKGVFGDIFGQKSSSLVNNDKAKANIKNQPRSLITLKDFDKDEIQNLVWVALDLKERMQGEGDKSPLLSGKTAAIVMDKDDMTAHLSAELAIKQLGGQALKVHPMKLQEANIKETACLLGGLADLIMVGCSHPSTTATLSDIQPTPVVNLTSDLLDPLQALAYLVTLQEYFGALHGLKVAYVGPGSPALNSLLYACAKLGVDLGVATPDGYEPDIDAMLAATKLYNFNRDHFKWGSTLNIGNNILKAVYRADCIITEPWICEGLTQDDAKARRKAFASYRIDRKILAESGGSWRHIHRLPQRSSEVSDDIMWGEESLSQQAVSNRVYATMAVALNILTDYQPQMPRPKFVKGE